MKMKKLEDIPINGIITGATAVSTPTPTNLPIVSTNTIISISLQDIKINPELDNAPPPPPPPGSPPTYLQQPILIRPPSPEQLLYFHYDSVVNSMYVSQISTPIPPRLLNQTRNTNNSNNSNNNNSNSKNSNNNNNITNSTSVPIYYNNSIKNNNNNNTPIIMNSEIDEKQSTTTITPIIQNSSPPQQIQNIVSIRNSPNIFQQQHQHQQQQQINYIHYNRFSHPPPNYNNSDSITGAGGRVSGVGGGNNSGGNAISVVVGGNNIIGNRIDNGISQNLTRICPQYENSYNINESTITSATAISEISSTFNTIQQFSTSTNLIGIIPISSPPSRMHHHQQQQQHIQNSSIAASSTIQQPQQQQHNELLIKESDSVRISDNNNDGITGIGEIDGINPSPPSNLI